MSYHLLDKNHGPELLWTFMQKKNIATCKSFVGNRDGNIEFNRDNPDHIGVKYQLVVLGGGEAHWAMYLFCPTHFFGLFSLLTSGICYD